jgi:hypothetical protein
VVRNRIPASQRTARQSTRDIGGRIFDIAGRKEYATSQVWRAHGSFWLQILHKVADDIVCDFAWDSMGGSNSLCALALGQQCFTPVLRCSAQHTKGHESHVRDGATRMSGGVVRPARPDSESARRQELGLKVRLEGGPSRQGS